MRIPEHMRDERPPLTIRREFANRMLNMKGRGLEIGAYDRPLYGPTEANVQFLDYYTTEELADWARRDGLDPSMIVPVSYVVKQYNFADEIHEKFDYIVASHVIEHIPDIITWLQNAERVLLPGGRLFLVVPDKRFTFDHLRPLSTVDMIVQAFEERRTRPTYDAVFENIYMHRHVDARLVWDGEQSPEDLPKRFDYETASRISTEFYEREDRGVHSHVFTSDTFIAIVDELFRRRLIGLKRVGFHPTWNPNNEFFVALER